MIVELEKGIMQIYRLSGIGLMLGVVLLGGVACSEEPPTTEEVSAQANELLDQGQIEPAIRILENQLAEDPERVDLLEPLAFAYSAAGDPMMAAVTFAQISEIAPSEPEYLLYAAQSMQEAGDVKGATERYREYLVHRPDERGIWRILAELEQDQGNRSEALEAYLEAEEIEPSPDQKLEIGNLYLEANNLAQAQSWFARALNADSDYRDEALLGLLETAIRSRRFSDADNLMQRLDSEYPNRLDESELAYVRDQLEEWRQRREDAKEALAALERRQEQEDSSSAESSEEEASGSDSPEPEEPSDDAVAESSRENEEREEASETESREESGAEARERESDSAGSLAQQEAEEPEQESTEEESTREAEVEATPEFQNWLGRARAAAKGGRWQDAVGAYKKALLQDDLYADVWAELSEAYLQTGQYRWARATASEAQRRDPDNPKYVMQHIRAAQNIMEPDRLLKEMERAYRQHPNTPDIILVLARAYLELDDNTRNARILLDRYLDIAPQDHPKRDEARELRSQL